MSSPLAPARPFRIHRSELAVPATSPHFFEKAAKGPADVIFIDLEDAVSFDKKAEARKATIDALNDIDWGRKTMAVRVNSLDTEWAHRDIIDVASNCPRLDLILLPKVMSAFDVQFTDTLLTGIEKETRRQSRIGIELLIETTMGLLNVETIAASSDRLEAMIFGIGDYSISLQTFETLIGASNPDYAVLTDPDADGVRTTHWNDHWHFASARIANACRAYGLRPIDGPYTNFGDPDGYKAAAKRSRALGFEGKWAIHPSQAPLANEIYSPTEAQVQWAMEITEEIKKAQAAGRGAFAIRGQLIDLAHLKLAQNILGRCELLAAADN